MQQQWESANAYEATPIRVISGVDVELDINLMFDVHVHKVCTLWGLTNSDDHNTELDAKVRLAGLLWDDHGQPRYAAVVPNTRDNLSVVLFVKLDEDKPDATDVGEVLLKEGLVLLTIDDLPSPYVSR